MKSFFSWIGGKNCLKKVINEHMPSEFNRYIEVFGGAAWVLFHKDKYASIEVYNDFNSELVNLFKCVKYHRPELQRELSYMLNSREIFEDLRDQYSVRGLTDIQRAGRFFFLLKTSYGSNGRSYGCIKKDVLVMTEYLTRIEERLSSVIVENKDFADIIQVYDRPDAFFYLDPPYYGTEKYYQVQFSEDDHKRLHKTLTKIKGKFLLSYNDCEFVRQLYSDFEIIEVQRIHNLKVRYGGDTVYNELLIKNYKER